jgi:hypothetical protein
MSLPILPQSQRGDWFGSVPGAVATGSIGMSGLIFATEPVATAPGTDSPRGDAYLEFRALNNKG